MSISSIYGQDDKLSIVGVDRWPSGTGVEKIKVESLGLKPNRAFSVNNIYQIFETSGSSIGMGSQIEAVVKGIVTDFYHCSYFVDKEVIRKIAKIIFNEARNRS